MPKISVIVPIYNVEKYLNRCIDSILNQTFTDFECILVDDGSPDNCGKICDEYAKKDKRIKVIHKENGGLSDARNAGIDVAQGNYISFIDSDDYIHPQFYEIMLNLANEYKADIVCCHYQFVEPEYICKYGMYDYESISKKAKVILAQEFLQHYDKYYLSVSWRSACTKLYKKSVFSNIRYPKGKIDEDSFILPNLIGNSQKLVRIEDKLYYYVVSSNSITRNDFKPKEFKGFDEYSADIERVSFFQKLGIKTQIDFFKRQYLLDTLKMYYMLKNEYPEHLAEFKEYVSEYRGHIWKFIKNNNKICNIEKVIYSIFFVSPKMAERLYNKYLK